MYTQLQQKDKTETDLKSQLALMSKTLDQGQTEMTTVLAKLEKVIHFIHSPIILNNPQQSLTIVWLQAEMDTKLSRAQVDQLNRTIDQLLGKGYSIFLLQLLLRS